MVAKAAAFNFREDSRLLDIAKKPPEHHLERFVFPGFWPRRIWPVWSLIVIQVNHQPFTLLIILSPATFVHPVSADEGGRLIVPRLGRH